MVRIPYLLKKALDHSEIDIKAVDNTIIAEHEKRIAEHEKRIAEHEKRIQEIEETLRRYKLLIETLYLAVGLPAGFTYFAEAAQKKTAKKRPNGVDRGVNFKT